MFLAIVAAARGQPPGAGKSPLAENGVAFTDEPGCPPTAFLGRLGQGQGRGDDVDAVQKTVNVAPLDAIAFGHDDQPQAVDGIQAAAHFLFRPQPPQTAALVKNFLVDLQHQRQHGPEEQGLAGLYFANRFHVLGQPGQENTGHGAGPFGHGVPVVI